MKIHQLIYFQEVAHELHFTRAAEKLYVSQSSLSHAIQELETELDAPLFLRRNGKRISLTGYGEAFLPFVTRALRELEDGRLAVENMVRPDSGHVNLAYTYINVCNTIVDLLDNFEQSQGNAAISVHSIVNHGGRRFIEESLALREADLAFSCYDFAESNYVKAVKIAEQRLYAALPVNHPLAERKTLCLNDLRREQIIMLTGSLHLHDWVISMFQKEGITPAYAEGCKDWTSQLMAVERGAGAAILPKIDTAQNRVAYVPLDHAQNKRNLYLLQPADRELSNAANRFREFCIDYFKKQEDRQWE